MTLDAPVVVRRKDLVVPTFLELAPGENKASTRRRIRALELTTALVVFLISSGFWNVSIPFAVAFAGIHILWALVVKAVGARQILNTLGAVPATGDVLENIIQGLPFRPEVMTVVGSSPDVLAIAGKVILTTATMDLSRLELEASLAHGLVRVRDGDAQLATTYSLMASGPALLNGVARVLAIVAFVPLLVSRMFKATAPKYMFRADVAASLVTRFPPSTTAILRLASAPPLSAPRSLDRFWLSSGHPMSIAERIGQVSEM